MRWDAAALAKMPAGECYQEILRSPGLSLGVYRLPAGATDTQRPHGEDEVYVVLRGRARFRNGAEDSEVGPTDTLFVARGVEHRFYDIREDLELLVVFGPPEGSSA